MTVMDLFRSSTLNIMRSVIPGVPCPETLLVVVMSNGGYLLVGYPQGGPTAYVDGHDAGPLSQALRAAFESFTSHG